jgi:hypothetical protein
MRQGASGLAQEWAILKHPDFIKLLNAYFL